MQEAEAPAFLLVVEIQEEEEEPAQLGGMEKEQEDQSTSNSVGGKMRKYNNQEEESGEDVPEINRIEGIENLGAPTAELEDGSALDAVTVEDEFVGPIMIKGNVEVLTIESSLEWM